MNCPNCGAPLEPNTRFCGKCGTIIQNNNAQGQYQQNQYQQNQYQYQQNQYQQNQYQQYQYQQNPYWNNRYGNGPVRPVRFPQRNIVMCIILTIVTCGIYGIVWTIDLCDDLNDAADNPGGTSGGMLILLSLVTCGIYGLYWLYKAGEEINKAKTMRGIPADSNAGVIYLILAIFGLSIVSFALIQSELNNIAAFYGAPPA